MINTVHDNRLAEWLAEADRVINDPPGDLASVLETLEAVSSAARESLASHGPGVTPVCGEYNYPVHPSSDDCPGSILWPSASTPRKVRDSMRVHLFSTLWLVLACATAVIITCLAC